MVQPIYYIGMTQYAAEPAVAQPEGATVVFNMPVTAYFMLMHP